ncbi:MAG: dTDP-4-dehydrorhamnose 3,5-epimerase [Desulfohalobiaceae bacterium]|nr:dTDP-4-dehydrorhamnose 3,5-epimerase [Desulfohalobiaceae bacterium]
MEFIDTAIPEVLLVKPKIFEDHRGFFMETWQTKTFARVGITADFVQDNHSRSARGVLRGLHYQIQKSQGKLVRVIFGEIYDVAVDLRKSSATFGSWVGNILSAENKQMLWIPPGFAHGFYVLSQCAECVYKCTDYYAPEHERTVLWNDPDLCISWPLPKNEEPIVSQKDAAGKKLCEAEVFE